MSSKDASEKEIPDPRSQKTWIRNLLFIGFMILAFTPSGPILTDTADDISIVMYHMAFTFMWWGALSGISYLYNRYELTHPRLEPSCTESTVYRLETELLIGRSDNLDKVLNNLRSGVAVFLAVFTAIFVWALNYSPFPEFTNLMLAVASCSVVVLIIIGVLYSYADISLHVNGVFIGEGLLPTVESEEEYKDQLEAVIEAKEDVLQAVRSLIGIGLLVFIIVNIVSFFLPQYGIFPKSYLFSENTLVENIVYLLFMAFYPFSLTGLLGFLFGLAVFTVGRPILGILDTSDLEHRISEYLNHFRDEQSDNEEEPEHLKESEDSTSIETHD